LEEEILKKQLYDLEKRKLSLVRNIRKINQKPWLDSMEVISLK